jgi:hypothetical protein
MFVESDTSQRSGLLVAKQRFSMYPSGLFFGVLTLGLAIQLALTMLVLRGSRSTQWH